MFLDQTAVFFVGARNTVNSAQFWSANIMPEKKSTEHS